MRPAAPGLSAPPPLPQTEVPTNEYYNPPADGDVVADEEDSVNVPPPPMDYLAHPESIPVHRPPARYQNLDYKKTLIPLLLSGAVCLAGVATSRSFARADTKIGSLPMWMVYGLYAVAVGSLVFGVLMMLQVASAIKAEKAAQSAPPDA